MKRFTNNMKMPKSAGWLVPGLQVKRWFAMIFLGALMMTIGFLILCDIKPVYYTMEFIKKVAAVASSELIATELFLLVQGYFLWVGKKQIFHF